MTTNFDLSKTYDCRQLEAVCNTHPSDRDQNNKPDACDLIIGN